MPMSSFWNMMDASNVMKMARMIDSWRIIYFLENITSQGIGVGEKWILELLMPNSFLSYFWNSIIFWLEFMSMGERLLLCFFIWILLSVLNSSTSWNLSFDSRSFIQNPNYFTVWQAKNFDNSLKLRSDEDLVTNAQVYLENRVVIGDWMFIDSETWNEIFFDRIWRLLFKFFLERSSRGLFTAISRFRFLNIFNHGFISF